VFKLVNQKKNQCENLSSEQVENRALEAIERFRRENPKIDPKKKIFIVLGLYQDMRDALLAKGWVENPVSNFDNENDYRNHAFHFIYTTKSRDAFKFQTAPWQ
jgi:hypothetical protein